MNESWEDPPYHNRAEYKKLCEESKSSDFYFYVYDESFEYDDTDDNQDDVAYVAIIPKAYFHANNCMWDQSMFLDHLLPNGYCECMEGVWDVECSKEFARKQMLDSGFEENKKFTEMCQKG